MKRFAYWLYTAACALAIVLTCVTAAHAQVCRWDRPGADPFMGEVPSAVDRYADIPADVRATLRDRMARHAYDDVVDIRRDSIVGAYRYDATIRDMHFGQGRTCSTVTRGRWADDTHERGLVYCESGHCVMVPTVCRNVSRITRLVPPMAPTGRLSFEQLMTALPEVGYVPPVEDEGSRVHYLSESRVRFSDPSSPTREGYSDPPPVPVFVDVPPAPVTPVPEPAEWALMAAGLLVLVTRRAVT
jgi:hypothetical protein